MRASVTICLTRLPSCDPGLTSRSPGKTVANTRVSISSEKVQVSLSFVPEPMKVGSGHEHQSKPRTTSGPLTTRSASSFSLDHVTAISSSPSSKHSSKRGTSAIPKEPCSAWSAPSCRSRRLLRHHARVSSRLRDWPMSTSLSTGRYPRGWMTF